MRRGSGYVMDVARTKLRIGRVEEVCFMIRPYVRPVYRRYNKLFVKMVEPPSYPVSTYLATLTTSRPTSRRVL